MDKICKKILNEMITLGSGTSYSCIFSASENDFFISYFSEKLGIAYKDILFAMEYLAENGYLSYEMSGQNKIGFRLSHKGLHWKEFRRKQVLNYIADKWVDILASVISLISLIISIIALMRG